MGENESNIKSLKLSTYRPEIDGLRAFAVITVIINHFNHEILPGGFLGVDIFFVISGYVITSSLKKRQSKNFLDFLSGFFERRIKRLVPALAIYVLITSILICLFNPLPGVSLQTGITSIFGVSNFYLFQQSTNYFAQSTTANVFTHTWSLGVEEQFYLVFPFLIWFSGFGRNTRNGERNLFIFISSLTIASFLGFIYLYPINQPAAYFLMPSRFWEMAAGCLIFLILQKRNSIKDFLENSTPFFVLGLIIGVMFLPNSLTSFTTFAVVVLTCFLISGLKKKTPSYKIFANSNVVYIGRISYSLYLWHWGVLSISRWTIGIQWWSIPLQVALMLGLALASYHYIETPFRNKTWFQKRWKTFLFNFGLLISLTLSLFILGISLHRKIYLGDKKSKTKIIESCSLTSSKFLVVGDSHAKEISKAVNIATESDCMLAKKSKDIGDSFLFSYKPFGKKGGKPSIEVQLIEPDLFISRAKKSDYTHIVISPYWLGFFAPEENALNSYDWVVRRHLSASGLKIKWDQALFKYVKSLKDLALSLEDTNFILIAPGPEFNWVGGGGLSELRTCEKQWFQLVVPPDISQACALYAKPSIIERSYIEKRRSIIMEELQKLDVQLENVYIFDPMPIICEEKVCSTHDIKGERQYRDDDHLSSYGASKLAPKLTEFLKDINSI